MRTSLTHDNQINLDHTTIITTRTQPPTTLFLCSFLSPHPIALLVLISYVPNLLQGLAGYYCTYYYHLNRLAFERQKKGVDGYFLGCFLSREVGRPQGGHIPRKARDCTSAKAGCWNTTTVAWYRWRTFLYEIQFLCFLRPITDPAVLSVNTRYLIAARTGVSHRNP